jgi:hypothetical protein
VRHYLKNNQSKKGLRAQLKRYSSSLGSVRLWVQTWILKIKIKTTMKYHYIPIRMWRQKSKPHSFQTRRKRNWNIHPPLWEYRMSQPVWKQVRHFLLFISSLFNVFFFIAKQYVYILKWYNVMFGLIKILNNEQLSIINISIIFYHFFLVNTFKIFF